MKYTLFALALTPVLLTGCGGGSSSSDHDISKAINEGLNSSNNNIQQIVENTDASSSQKSKDSISETANVNTEKNNPSPVNAVDKNQIQEPQHKEGSDLNSIQHSDDKNRLLAIQNEVNEWLVKGDNQKIAQKFIDAGFTEQQVYNLCKFTQTSSSTVFACEIEPSINGQQATVYTMHNDSKFTVDANTNGFVTMTYNPTDGKMVLTKTFYSDDADILKNIAGLKTVDLNGVSSPTVNITRKTDEVTVSVPLTMDNPVVKELKNIYLNNANKKAIAQLKLSDNKNFSITFTKGMETSQENGDDLAVFSSNIQKIVTVAGL